MLARTTKIRHPSQAGLTIQTPLLVPSFSSKGFGTAVRSRKRVSEAKEIFKVAKEFLTDSMLLSAYDIYHGFIPKPTRMITDITIVDSGGYETSNAHDLSATFVTAVNPEPWNEEMYQEVLSKWPRQIPAIFVSFDDERRRHSLAKQIERARRTLGPHRSQLRAFLIKPERRHDSRLPIKQIIAHVDDLGDFDIIGVTEKELGDSFLDRMVNIAHIRTSLDQAGILAPIHVFGSLDPISVPLYFFAGAEIFDGLTWLRYGYTTGMAVYRHNFAAKRLDIHRTDDFVKVKAMQDNLGALVQLTHEMRKFLIDRDYSKFGENENLMREAVYLLRTKFPGRD